MGDGVVPGNGGRGERERGWREGSGICGCLAVWEMSDVEGEELDWYAATPGVL